MKNIKLGNGLYSLKTSKPSEGRSIIISDLPTRATSGSIVDNPGESIPVCIIEFSSIESIDIMIKQLQLLKGEE